MVTRGKRLNISASRSPSEISLVDLAHAPSLASLERVTLLNRRRGNNVDAGE
jgi:hypothetical protein